MQKVYSLIFLICPIIFLSSCLTTAGSRTNNTVSLVTTSEIPNVALDHYCSSEQKTFSNKNSTKLEYIIMDSLNSLGFSANLFSPNDQETSYVTDFEENMITANGQNRGYVFKLSLWVIPSMRSDKNIHITVKSCLAYRNMSLKHWYSDCFLSPDTDEQIKMIITKFFNLLKQNLESC